jgi:hypothetical protein
MKLCGPDCHPICDFCYWQDQTARYSGEGFCWRHFKFTDLCTYCEDYYCFLVRAIPKWRKHLLWLIRPFAQRHF